MWSPPTPEVEVVAGGAGGLEIALPRAGSTLGGPQPPASPSFLTRRARNKSATPASLLHLKQSVAFPQDGMGSTLHLKRASPATETKEAALEFACM